LDGKDDIGFASQFRKVSENDNGKQRAAKNKNQASKKQKQKIQKYVGTPKRDWNKKLPAPE
jgi:hypothetical protein